MTTRDKILISIDRNPFGGLVRILIGFLFIPALSRLKKDAGLHWTLIIQFVMLLVTIRIVPIVVRKLLRPSSEAQAVLAERRRIAKRYDSFQWQKLFFLGIGLACYTVVWNQSLWPIVLSSFCIACGGIGVVRWYMQASKVREGLVHEHVL